jgi:protocatechuate 3,4-dioxygenase beta subunit
MPVDRFTVDVRLKQGEGWNSVGSEQFTAAKGEFRTGAQVGKCRIVVTSEGLAMKGEPEVEVTEAGGQVDIVMGQAATLTGTLTSKGGEPLKGASIQVSLATKEEENNSGHGGMRWFGGRGGSFDGPYWRDHDNGGYWASTDNRGRYRIIGIVPGEYSIVATFGGGNETRKAVLNPGANVQDFSLDAGCLATVKIIDPRGKPVLSAWVYFHAPDGNYLNTVGMPQQKPGEYIFGGMPPGKCSMQVGAQGYPQWRKEIELKAGENRFEVQLAEGAYLEGRVTTSGGAGVREHYVRIGKPGKISEDDWQEGMYAQTDAKGAFRLGPVEPGDYELRLSSNNQQKVSSVSVRLVAGDNKQDMVVESQCSLKVTVKKAGGELLQWCNVSVSAADNSRHDNQSTDAKGECEFHFLKEGDCTLTAYSQEGTQATQQIHLRRGGNEVTIELRAPDCVKITWVEDEGEAFRAGLKVGDLVTSYNGTATPTLQKLAELVRTTDNTVTVSIAIVREGAAMTITAKGGLLGVHGDNHAR